MNLISEKLNSLIISLLGLDFNVDMQEALFSEIKPGLYLGSRPKPEQITALKEKGMTHIVSCLNPEKRSEMVFLNTHFQTLFLPMKDGINEDISSVFEEFFAFNDRVHCNSQKAKMLVHCEVGVSRSASLIIALLMRLEKKSFLDTYHEVRSKRAKILPNIGFASQLQELEHTLGIQKNTRGNISSLASYLHQICTVPAEIELLQNMLEKHNYNALSAIQSIFGEDIPRVIQGVRL